MKPEYDKLIPALKNLLPVEPLDALGRAVAFIRRLREIRASAFVWCVVLSRFGSGRPGFEQARQWYTRLANIQLWPRPFQMRFKQRSAVALFERAFAQAVEPWRNAADRRPRHFLGRRFCDIVAVDSTWMQVADELRPIFKGTIGGIAALKVLLSVSLFGLVPVAAQIVAGNCQDMSLFPSLDLFRPDTLLLFDKGFVAYDRLHQLQQASLKYLCPMRLNGNPLVVGACSAPSYVRKALKRSPQGVRLRDLLPKSRKLSRSWDLEVVLQPKAVDSAKSPVCSRLVIVPGRKREQHPYLTNLPAVEWKPAVLRELYRLRWQIELVFKELKQNLNLETLPSKDRYSVQIFAWASLIALALSRTVAAWLCPLRRIIGLSSAIRPMIITRALRATIRLLAHAMVVPLRQALSMLQLFADELLAEAQTLEAGREDSFKRLAA
jgi:hypothetical protein